MELSGMNCVQPREGDRPLAAGKAAEMARLVEHWTLGKTELSREFTFPSFTETMLFVNKVAVEAEGQGHHPDIYISYRKVCLTLTTHKIGGLSQNDFIMAARIDGLTAAAPAEAAAL